MFLMQMELVRMTAQTALFTSTTFLAAFGLTSVLRLLLRGIMDTED